MDRYVRIVKVAIRKCTKILQIYFARKAIKIVFYSSNYFFGWALVLIAPKFNTFSNYKLLAENNPRCLDQCFF